MENNSKLASDYFFTIGRVHCHALSKTPWSFFEIYLSIAYIAQYMI